MNMKKTLLLLVGLALVGHRASALSSKSEVNRGPIVEKTSALPTARTPVFIQFLDEEGSKKSIQFIEMKPGVKKFTIIPGDRRKIVEIPRTIFKTSPRFLLKGELTLPDKNVVQLFVRLGDGKLSFCVAKDIKSSARCDFFEIKKPVGEEDYVFGNYRVKVKFYISIFNKTYHTIEIIVSPKDMQSEEFLEVTKEELEENPEEQEWQFSEIKGEKTPGSEEETDWLDVVEK